MDGDRTARALARIEAASARIAAVAGQRPPPDDKLAARHAALRAQTAAALTDLDNLIEGFGI